MVTAALDGHLADLDRMISDADRVVVGGRKVQPLTAGARATLRDWVDDLAERLRAWRRANDLASRPEHDRHGTNNREALRRALRHAQRDLEGLDAAANGLADDSGGVGLALAAQVSRDTVGSVLRLFDGPDLSRLTPEMRFGDELLLLPTTWRLADVADWSHAKLETFFAEVEATAGEVPDFRSAFERSLAAGHLPQAAQARDRLAIEDPASRDEVEAWFEGARDRQMAEARATLATVRKRLNDLLGADDRQVLGRDLEPDLDKLGRVLQAGDPQIDLSDWRTRLGEIVGALDDASDNLLGPLHERVNRLEEGGHSVSDLRKMEEMRNLTTLAEHIEAYEKGATPPDPPSSLMEAFSRHLSVKQERRADLPSLQRAVAQRECLEEVDYSSFDDGQLETASTLLQAWRDLRQNDGQDSDTAQQTSPEMFFGRSDELRELWDPNGSCLVYGGRQLGKTALLRQIELRHRSADQVVIYGDQMAEGFGDGRSAFWRWIGKAVQARGLQVSTRPASEDVRSAIRDWLAAEGVRRVLFLVDEADAFLRSEIRNGFKVLVEVRELMRVTNRRCKFVFAGLHDVQRLARTPNSPLLHFGNPIRVGPLMGKDLFEARSMVEQPMAAAGYAFGRTAEEGRALVGRALSEVGYSGEICGRFDGSDPARAPHSASTAPPGRVGAIRRRPAAAIPIRLRTASRPIAT